MAHLVKDSWRAIADNEAYQKVLRSFGSNRIAALKWLRTQFDLTLQQAQLVLGMWQRFKKDCLDRKG